MRADVSECEDGDTQSYHHVYVKLEDLEGCGRRSRLYPTGGEHIAELRYSTQLSRKQSVMYVTAIYFTRTTIPYKKQVKSIIKPSMDISYEYQ